MLHFREGELGIPVDTAGKTILALTLNGNLNSWASIQGTDDVRITPNNEKSRGKGGDNGNGNGRGGR